MTDLRAPRAGGRMILRPTTDGGYTSEKVPLEDPLEGASEAEREFYLANYQGVPLAELLRRLRTAEWNAREYKQQAEQLRAQAKAMPPLYLIREMDARHKRVRAVLDVPRRRNIPRAELLAAFDDPTTETRTP